MMSLWFNLNVDVWVVPRVKKRIVFETRPADFTKDDDDCYYYNNSQDKEHEGPPVQVAGWSPVPGRGECVSENNNNKNV